MPKLVAIALVGTFGILLAVASFIVFRLQRRARLLRDQYESERKQRDARPMLKHSDDCFQLMVQNVSDVIGMVNREGVVTYISPSVERVTGFKPHELMLPFVEVIHPDDIQTALAAFRDIIQRPGRSECIAIRMKCKEGDFKHLQAVAFNCLDVPGIDGIVFNAWDISERMQSEAALQKSEGLYRSLFDNMLNGLAHCKMLFEDGRANDFVYLEVNDTFETLTGLKNVVGRKVSEVIPGIQESDPELLEIYGRVVLTGKPAKFERYIAALQMWFLISVYSPAREYFVAVFDVITERKRAEEVLRESEERYKALFERSLDMVYVHDCEGRFIDANDTALKLLGYQREELRSITFASLLSEDQLLLASKTLKEIVETGGQKQLTEFRLRGRNGNTVYVETKGSAIHSMGALVAIQGIARDLTEKIKLQATVAQADRLASMGMLAAGVAHEINNPLSYVLYNVESLAQDLPMLVGATQRCCSALRDRVGDAVFEEIAGDGAELLQPTLLEETIERARDALSGGQRIKVIARGLGTFSRVERDEQSRVELKYAIECAINMSFNEIKYRARLVKDFGPVPTVLASEGKLSQVFLNLLINAAHSIDEGHADDNRIRIRTWTEDNDVFAEITDTGKGILPENLERIFDPFFTTKAVGVGSGLGLAICKNIIAEFGGDIRVESEVGRGTRFVVRLPVRQQVPEDQGVAVVADNGQAPKLRGRILVVDDEPLIRSSMRRILGNEHDVVTAASGDAARTLLEQDGSYDVILCDVMMPNMSGMELHEWLANRDSALAGRMIFLTGGAYTPWASEYVANAGNLRIEKPVDTANLKRVVMERVLEHKRTRELARVEDP